MRIEIRDVVVWAEHGVDVMKTGSGSLPWSARQTPRTRPRQSRRRWRLPPLRAIERWLSLEQFDVHPHQITSWKAQLEEGSSDVFAPSGGHGAAPDVDVKSLNAKIGDLMLEKRFFRGRAQQCGIAERKAMIDQADVLHISRGSVYYCRVQC